MDLKSKHERTDYYKDSIEIVHQRDWKVSRSLRFPKQGEIPRNQPLVENRARERDTWI